MRPSTDNASKLQTPRSTTVFNPLRVTTAKRDETAPAPCGWTNASDDPSALAPPTRPRAATSGNDHRPRTVEDQDNDPRTRSTRVADPTWPIRHAPAAPSTGITSAAGDAAPRSATTPDTSRAARTMTDRQRIPSSTPPSVEWFPRRTIPGCRTTAVGTSHRRTAQRHAVVRPRCVRSRPTPTHTSGSRRSWRSRPSDRQQSLSRESRPVAHLAPRPRSNAQSATRPDITRITAGYSAGQWVLWSERSVRVVLVGRAAAVGPFTAP